MTAAPPSAPAGQVPAVSALRRLVEGRRSIRRYQDRAIDSAVLEDLLTFAMWAPSAHNRQPWRFCVATQADAKERLATMLGARWRRDLEADGAAQQEIARRTAASYARITGAPALIVVALDMAGRRDDGRAEYGASLPELAPGGPRLWAGRMLDVCTALCA